MNDDAFSLGQLHARVTGLEKRADNQESVLKSMDGKLDDVLLALASAVGGRDKIRALLKAGAGVATVAAGCVAVAGALMHFVTFGIIK